MDFTIVQNDAPLTSSAAFDILDELQSTKFGWIRTVVCSRMSCSGLRSTGLLGGCSPFFKLISFFGGHYSGTASMTTAVSAGAATTGVRGGIGLFSNAVTMATVVSAGAATAGVRGGIGLFSHAVTMATAVSAGAATAGVRGGIGLFSHAVTMATAVSAGAATAGVRGGVGLFSHAVPMATAVSAVAATTGVRGGVGLFSHAVTMATAASAGAATAGVRGGIGLCSFAASVITLVTVAAANPESWNTYMVNDHRLAFLKLLTAFWTDATCRISASFPIHLSYSQILCVGHTAIEYEHNSLLLRWFIKIFEMSQPSNKHWISSLCLRRSTI